MLYNILHWSALSSLCNTARSWEDTDQVLILERSLACIMYPGLYDIARVCNNCISSSFLAIIWYRWYINNNPLHNMRFIIARPYIYYHQKWEKQQQVGTNINHGSSWPSVLFEGDVSTAYTKIFETPNPSTGLFVPPYKTISAYGICEMFIQIRSDIPGLVSNIIHCVIFKVFTFLFIPYQHCHESFCCNSLGSVQIWIFCANMCSFSPGWQTYNRETDL